MQPRTQKPQRTRVKITDRALFQRINRKLKDEGEQLRTARTQDIESSMGRYFIIDLTLNSVIERNQNLEKLGRKLGVLQPWEELTE